MELNLTMNYPLITCYPNHANLLSIVSLHKEYYPWLFNNYVQLFVDKNDYKFNMLRLDFYTNNLWQSCPLAYTQKISRELINSSYTSIVEFCITVLKTNSYIYFLADSFYVKNYEDLFQKSHQAHDIFIYGVNTGTNTFLAADNFKNGKYSYEEVSFNDIITAYENVEQLKLDDWIEGVSLIKPRQKADFFGLEHYYKFDLEKLIVELSDYLNSYNTAKRYCNPYDQWMINISEMAFGLEVYDVIIHFLKNVEQVYDRRPLYVLYEHKKVMQMRIDYLCSELNINANHIKSDYNNLVESAEILNTLYLKYIFTKNPTIREKVINGLKEQSASEETLLKELLSILKEEVNTL